MHCPEYFGGVWTSNCPDAIPPIGPIFHIPCRFMWRLHRPHFPIPRFQTEGDSETGSLITTRVPAASARSSLRVGQRWEFLAWHSSCALCFMLYMFDSNRWTSIIPVLTRYRRFVSSNSAFSRSRKSEFRHLAQHVRYYCWTMSLRSFVWRFDDQYLAARTVKVVSAAGDEYVPLRSPPTELANCRQPFRPSRRQE